MFRIRDLLRDPKGTFERGINELAAQPPYVRFEPKDGGMLGLADQMRDATKPKGAFENVNPLELALAIDVVLFPTLICAQSVLRLAPKECSYALIPALQTVRASKHLCGPRAKGALEFIEERFADLLATA